MTFDVRSAMFSGCATAGLAAGRVAMPGYASADHYDLLSQDCIQGMVLLADDSFVILNNLEDADDLRASEDAKREGGRIPLSDLLADLNDDD